MIRTFAAMAFATITPLSALAEPVVDAVQSYCVTPLHGDTALGFGLTRASAQMEAQLLNGKDAALFRTDSPNILVVAHNSGQTCEVMALGTDQSDFVAATGDLSLDGGVFAQSADTVYFADKPGGGYLVAPRDAGGFIQAFVTTHPESRFIGVTVGRVADSAMAREVLGLD
ncbi:hypothetical protein [Celeribacter arenosi]|uniref:Uncharacterized protein n=1 Tax=Celeribacter arenosi TaxID=792649 RepID=A0ABP7JWD8_9RHOB